MSFPKKILLPLTIVLGSVLVAFVLVLSRPDVETAAPKIPARWIRALRVTAEPVQMKISSQGTVRPRTETALVAEVAGRVTSVSFAFVAGGFFEAGDVLLVIDSRDYEFALEQARAAVVQVEVRLQVTEREGHLARTEWAKRNEGEMPALVTYEPQLAEARAALAAARANLQQAELNFERTRIRAPYAGRVRSKAADVGQYLTPGAPVGSVYAVDYVEIRLPLPDRELEFLGIPFDFSTEKAGRRGPAVSLRGSFAGRSAKWQGHVTRIEGEIDARSRMIYAVARVEDPYGRNNSDNTPPLAVGMFVEAEISGALVESLIRIPRVALRDNDRVLVVLDDGTLRFRRVDIARFAAEEVFVRDGLTDGETICISPLAVAVDGMPVRILTEDTGPGGRAGGSAP